MFAYAVNDTLQPVYTNVWAKVCEIAILETTIIIIIIINQLKWHERGRLLVRMFVRTSISSCIAISSYTEIHFSFRTMSLPSTQFSKRSHTTFVNFTLTLKHQMSMHTKWLPTSHPLITKIIPFAVGAHFVQSKHWLNQC